VFIGRSRTLLLKTIPAQVGPIQIIPAIGDGSEIAHMILSELRMEEGGELIIQDGVDLVIADGPVAAYMRVSGEVEYEG
jgi:hypothetical protein